MSASARAPVGGVADPRVPLDHPLGRRISIVGGGGKTTLARALSVKLRLTFIELDALHWKPGWVESSADELRAKTEGAIAAAPDGWVVDGQYHGKIGDLVVRQADTVIWVNMPWRVMFCRVFIRSLQRAKDRQKICGENYESWRLTFFSPKSLLWWHITSRRRYRQRGERLLPMIPAGVPLIDLSSPKLLDRFYDTHGLSRE
ncbi:MAG: hypothetical protein EXR57_06510 [Dehalococcoidia bacterium]|nr:hypothetical protein [Dehalococcoidia bacterium]MSQ35443.1 hypothetical protein [Dehalococcoidia bacterium]